jgi:hypothetical protein
MHDIPRTYGIDFTGCPTNDKNIGTRRKRERRAALQVSN